MIQSPMFPIGGGKRPGPELGVPGLLALPGNPVWVRQYWDRLYPDLEMARRAFYSPFLKGQQRAVEGVRLLSHFTDLSERIMKEIHIMPEKKKAIAVRGWVNMSIDDAAKEEIVTIAAAPQQVLADFASLVFRGYRLSVTWDDYSSALQASLVCADPESVNAGYGVSARHPDIDLCLATLWYKVSVLGTSPWESFISGPKGSSWS